MNQERAKQQQGEEEPGSQQGGWDSGQDKQQGGIGRKPGSERDRDHDPDGDRIGRKI